MKVFGTLRYKDKTGYHWTKEFDEQGNEIHFVNSIGEEWWREWDKDGNELRYWDNKGVTWTRGGANATLPYEPILDGSE
jgi:hypothetical protein